MLNVGSSGLLDAVISSDVMSLTEVDFCVVARSFSSWFRRLFVLLLASVNAECSLLTSKLIELSNCLSCSTVCWEICGGLVVVGMSSTGIFMLLVAEWLFLRVSFF